MATTSKRRKGKAQPSRTLEQVALEQFAESGEVSGLGVLADWVEENGGSAEYAAKLREVMSDPFKADAVRFFWEHAGYGHDPKTQTAEQGRFERACGLREAEEFFDDYEADEYDTDPPTDALRYTWEIDADYNPNDYDYPGAEIGWACFLWAFDGRRWHVAEALGGITFGGNGDPWGKGYMRVVEAELVSQYMA